MTDHDNADDADGQNSKLSRRTALGLMGASAVGGAAASSAYSELTANRPINVGVTTSSPDVVTADSGTSEIEVTNNSDSSFDVTIDTDNTNVTRAVSGEEPPWTISNIDNGATESIEFTHDDGTDTATEVTFDVNAYSSTDGLGINTSQAVSVAPSISTTNLAHRHRASELGASEGDLISSWADSVGSMSLDAPEDDRRPTYTESAINDKPGLEFKDPDSEEPIKELNGSLQEGVIDDTDYTVVVISMFTDTIDDLHYIPNFDGNDRSIHKFGSEGLNYWDGDWVQIAPETPSQNIPYVTGVRREVDTDADEATVSGRVNGNSGNGTADIQNSDGAAQFASSGHGYPGPIAEIIIYEDSITDSEWDRIENYAAAAYGIDLSS